MRVWKDSRITGTLENTQIFFCRICGFESDLYEIVDDHVEEIHRLQLRVAKFETPSLAMWFQRQRILR